MWHLIRVCGLMLVATAVLAAETPAQEKVELKVVKYAELGQLVQQHKGKVILVDLWATW